LIFVVILGCLFPLAGYSLLLAAINRRPHPVVLSGCWDWAGVLFAASGFLLLAGPFLLVSFQQRWREAWLYSSTPGSVAVLRQSWTLQVGLWLAYFTTVLAGSLLILWRRRLVTAIYNVEPEAVSQALDRVLETLDLEGRRSGHRLRIGNRDAPAPSNDRTAESVRSLVLEVDPFPAMRHVTLSWPANAEPLRGVIEAELVRVLNEVPTHDNPAGSWLLTVAGSLFLAICLTLLALVISFLQQHLKSGW
jgi:hypothetical protein